MKHDKTPYDDPFEQRYLRAINALHALGAELEFVGMGGCDEFKRLTAAVVKHGSDTFRDIQRDQP